MDKTTEQKVIETLVLINDAIKKDHHILINEGCPIHGRIERLINEIPKK